MSQGDDGDETGEINPFLNSEYLRINAAVNAAPPVKVDWVYPEGETWNTTVDYIKENDDTSASDVLQELRQYLPMLLPGDLLQAYALVDKKVSHIIKRAQELELPSQTYTEEQILAWLEEISANVTEAGEILREQDLLNRTWLVGFNNGGIEAGEHKVWKVSLGFEPSLEDGSQPSPDDGPEIFDKILLSPRVPYVQYNDDKGPRFFKVYTGDPTRISPRYTNTILNDAGHGAIRLGKNVPASDAKKPNRIYMVLWTGDEPVENAPNEAYQRVTYNLETNIIDVESKSGGDIPDVERATRFLAEAAQGLRLNGAKTTKINGVFLLDNFSLDEAVLLDQVLNSWGAHFLYDEEKQKPAAERKDVTVHYRAPLYQRRSQVFHSRPWLGLPAKASITLAKISDTKVECSVSRIRYEEDFFEVITFLRGFLGFVKINHSNVRKVYGNISWDSAVKKSIQNKHVPIYKDSDWTSRCQPVARHPDILKENEVTEEIRRESNYRYDDVNKQHYRCNNPDYPHPGMVTIGPSDTAIKKNITINTKCGACCFAKPQSSHHIQKVCSGKTPGSRQSSTQYITAKIGDPGKENALDQTFQIFFGEGFSRLGMLRSANSFIECVLVAIKHTTYTREVDQRRRLEMLEQVRKDLYDHYLERPDVVAQEMFSYSTERIRKIFLNPSAFFDPLLFVRLVEEYFNIDIYIFSPAFRGRTASSIIPPRFTKFYARPPNNRPVVLVLRSMGAASEGLKYPQCELIVKEKEGLFTDVNLKNKCYRTLIGTLPTVSIFAPYAVPNLTSVKYIDFDVVEGTVSRRCQTSPGVTMEAVAQRVDDAGKLRALVLQEGDVVLTLFTVPSQPQFLPTAAFVTDEAFQAGLPRVAAKTALKFFKGRAKDVSDGQIYGIWVENVSDPNVQDYVPVEITADSVDLPPGPEFIFYDTPAPDSSQSVVAPLRSKQQKLRYLLAIVEWLFEIDRKHGSGDPKEFAEKYFRVTGTAEDYDVSGLVFRFPLVDTVENGIINLHEFIPSFCSPTGALLFYSEDFARRMAGHLQELYLNTFGTTPNPPVRLRGFYREAEDFLPQDNVAIFTTLKGLKQWLATVWLDDLSWKERRDRPELANVKLIYSTPNIRMSFSIEPVIYEGVVDGEQGYWLIQNIPKRGNSEEEEERERILACYVYTTWDTERRNLGAIEVAPNSVSMSPSFKLYKIADNVSAGFVTASQRGNGEGGCKIIQWPARELNVTMYREAMDHNSRYAALLPLQERLNYPTD